jgi:hypothetical protein
MKTQSQIAVALTAIVINSAVLADDLLARLEIATEQLGENQGKFYVSRVPELADKLPDWEWDDEIRTASKCVLDGIEKEKGRAVAEAYVAGLELDAKRELTTMSQLSDQSNIPEQLRNGDQTILNLMQNCRTMEISAERLKASGFWDAMMDPKIMDKLVAE